MNRLFPAALVVSLVLSAGQLLALMVEVDLPIAVLLFAATLPLLVLPFCEH